MGRPGDEARATIAVCFLFESSSSINSQVQDNEGVYGVVMVAPSVTPYGHMNPSYRLYSMDRLTYQLLGYQQFHLNLTKANGGCGLRKARCM